MKCSTFTIDNYPIKAILTMAHDHSMMKPSAEQRTVWRRGFMIGLSDLPDLRQYSVKHNILQCLYADRVAC